MGVTVVSRRSHGVGWGLGKARMWGSVVVRNSRMTSAKGDCMSD